jgi:hypothetical protein
VPNTRAVIRLAHLRTVIAGSPSEPGRVSTRRRAATSLAFGLAVYVAFHLGLAFVADSSRFVRDPVYADKERKLRRLERSLPAGSPVTVFLGTSRTGNGFDAATAQRILAEQLGRPAGAFNHGLPASGPVTHLVHLERLLADGHRPSLLLLEIHSPTLANLSDGPLEARFAHGLAFDWDELDRLAGYGFPVEQLRSQRRDVLVAPWHAVRFQIVGRIAPTTLPFYLRYDWSRGRDAFGWSPMMVENVDDSRREAGLERARQEYQFILRTMKPGDDQGPGFQALRDILSLCQEQRIPVVLVRMPEGEGFRAMYTRALSRRLGRLLGEIAAEYTCTLADCREWLPDTAFADGHHLLPPAATAFTERLTREVIVPAVRALPEGGTR